MPQLPLRPQQQDTSPDHVYIKVHPARLRTLIREKKLSMSLLGILLVLALRIDNTNMAFPSIAKLAEDAGVSPRAIQIAMKKLAALGVISYAHEKGKTNAYVVHSAFGYGKQVETPDQKITPSELGDDQKITSTPDQKITSTPDQKITSTPDQKITLRQPEKEKPVQENPTQDNTVPDFSKIEKAERETLHWRLKQAGVKEPEACKIAYQYSRHVIDRAIQSAREKSVNNPGAYIRTICERQEGPIHYNTIQILPPIPAPPPEPANPYLLDEYFSRHTDPDETAEYIPADVGDK